MRYRIWLVFFHFALLHLKARLESSSRLRKAFLLELNLCSFLPQSDRRFEEEKVPRKARSKRGGLIHQWNSYRKKMELPYLQEPTRSRYQQYSGEQPSQSHFEGHVCF